MLKGRFSKFSIIVIEKALHLFTFEIEWTAPDIPTETWTGCNSVILLESSFNKSPEALSLSIPDVVIELDTAEAKMTSFNWSIEEDEISPVFCCAQYFYILLEAKGKL